MVAEAIIEPATYAVRIETSRFGALEIPEQDQVTLIDGLLGFEQHHAFCLIGHAPGSPFVWLQSMDDPALAFVTVNPFDFFADYDFEIADSDAAAIGLHHVRDAMVYTLVTITKQDVTANLVGPIIVNTRTGRAKQVVLTNSPYTTRHSITRTK